MGIFGFIKGERGIPTRKKAELMVKTFGKEPSKPANYRPRALPSNLCKIMERMVTERLTHEVEKRGMFQTNFRRARNTMDSVVMSEN